MLFVLFFLSLLFSNVLIVEIFYVFPITIVSWYGSSRAGLSLALFTTLMLMLLASFHRNLSNEMLFYYGVSHFFSFSFLAILITNFRKVHRSVSVEADTDYLTKVNNSRGFHVELANELVRSVRYKHQFSLAYLDIDNFKRVNDAHGHEAGDQLLYTVAESLQKSLRETDTVARIGGDEFACLLPETGQEEAKSAFLKASNLLARKMSLHDWPVTFSVGMVTFEAMPEDIKQAMKVADDLMYSVKSLEKDDVYYQVWRGKL